MIRTCGSEHLAIRAETAVQYASFVGRNLDVADQSRIAPDAQRVIWEPAGTDDLAVVIAPPQAGYLGAGVDAVRPGTGGSIPKMDVTIVRTTTRCKQVQLPWAPVKGLDGSTVVGLGEFGTA